LKRGSKLSIHGVLFHALNVSYQVMTSAMIANTKVHTLELVKARLVEKAKYPNKIVSITE
jgi:hypothetical protein